MKKLILKWILPRPEALAKITAKTIADFVNNSGKEEAISTFVEKTKDLQDAQFLVAEVLADGKIDEHETAMLEEKLQAVAELAYAKLLERID